MFWRDLFRQVYIWMGYNTLKQSGEALNEELGELRIRYRQVD